MNDAPRVAFDIGGTFTDIVVVSGEGNLRAYKVLSIAEQVAHDLRGPIEAVLKETGHKELASLVHGTTIASNAILEGKAIHAADLAAGLGMKRICIPLFPGLFSALGLMMADLRYDYVQSIPGRLDSINAAELLKKYDILGRRVREEVLKEAIDPQTLKLERFLDLRYQRQMSEITIRLPRGVAAPALIPELTELFHQEHERTYGYRRHGETIAAVNLRLKALAPAGSVSFAQLATGFLRSSGESCEGEGMRTAYFGPKIGERETRILPRTGLIGKSLMGPAVLEEFDTTVVVPIGWAASLDQYGNIILDALE